MIKLIKDIFDILNNRQKILFWGIQLLVIFVGFLEIINISILGYFVSLISETKTFNDNKFFLSITNFFFGDKVPDLLSVSIFLIFFLLISSIISVIANYLSIFLRL